MCPPRHPNYEEDVGASCRACKRPDGSTVAGRDRREGSFVANADPQPGWTCRPSARLPPQARPPGPLPKLYQYRALIHGLAYSGLRFGEAVSFTDTKTHAARPVSLPTFVVEEVACHLETVPADPGADVHVGHREAAFATPTSDGTTGSPRPQASVHGRPERTRPRAGPASHPKSYGTPAPPSSSRPGRTRSRSKPTSVTLDQGRPRHLRAPIRRSHG